MATLNEKPVRLLMHDMIVSQPPRHLMLIVSGRLFLKPGTRDQFLASCEPSIRLARVAAGCLDFAVSADTIDPDRANVYEAWTDAQSLEVFRGSGPDDPSFAFIVRADVERHEVSQSGPP